MPSARPNVARRARELFIATNLIRIIFSSARLSGIPDQNQWQQFWGWSGVTTSFGKARASCGGKDLSLLKLKIEVLMKDKLGRYGKNYVTAFEK